MAFTLTANTPNNNRPAGATGQREPSPFDGYWINVGATMTVDAEGGESTEKFVRIPRGIALSDLVPHKIYNSTNPDWAKEAGLVNQIIDALQRKAPELAEGESVDINLNVQLYRRQEESDVVVAPADSAKIDQALFGS